MIWFDAQCSHVALGWGDGRRLDSSAGSRRRLAWLEFPVDVAQSIDFVGARQVEMHGGDGDVPFGEFSYVGPRFELMIFDGVQATPEVGAASGVVAFFHDVVVTPHA